MMGLSETEKLSILKQIRGTDGDLMETADAIELIVPARAAVTCICLVMYDYVWHRTCSKLDITFQGERGEDVEVRLIQFVSLLLG